MSPEQKLVEVIEHEMAMGFRHFTIRGAELDTVLAAMREIGRLHGHIDHRNREIARLDSKLIEAAVFLDAMADTFDMYSDHEQDADNCRAMAKKLRGET
jgi:hypothetical protein